MRSERDPIHFLGSFHEAASVTHLPNIAQLTESVESSRKPKWFYWRQERLVLSTRCDRSFLDWMSGTLPSEWGESSIRGDSTCVTLGAFVGRTSRRFSCR